VQSVRKKEVTFKMVHDFYMEFVEVNEPSRRLKRAWRNLVLAALAFILTAILGNLDFPPFTDIISFPAYYSLTFAIGFLVIGFNDVYNVGKKIV
jgi:hypothetical protein